MEQPEEHYLKTELYEKLRTEPMLFEWIENGSVDGIWYWDLIDGEQEWLSPRFKQTFGYQDHEMENNVGWWQSNIHPDDYATALDNFNRHVEDANHPYDQIVRYKHKNGSTVWVRCRGLVVRDPSGKPVRMFGVHTDVSELKRAQMQLERKTVALERSNEELKRFAYIASHDLKSPIRAIRLILDWIEEDCADQLPEVAKGHLQQIKQRSDRMQTLLSDLLSYSTLESFDDAAEPVDSDEVLRPIFNDLNIDKQFTLQLSTHNLIIQRIPFELVMRNLLSNAFKHHDKDKGTINIGIQSDNDNYLISVSDDGPGIPEKYHAKIFELFQTLKPKDKTEGSGMGLSMVSKTLQNLGASITVTNLSPTGSCFSIQWPKP